MLLYEYNLLLQLYMNHEKHGVPECIGYSCTARPFSTRYSAGTQYTEITVSTVRGTADAPPRQVRAAPRQVQVPS